MDRILPARRNWPLHDAAGSRAVEQASQAGLPPHTLMRRAGQAVAALARALHPHARHAWIACGPGNNGGDGLDAAIHLRAAGLTVELTLAADRSRLPPDAADALTRAEAAGLHVAPATHRPATADFAIDALLGLGARRAPSGELLGLVHHLNALPCPVLAVDLPSGLDADTGQPFGEACVRASHTLSLLTLKPGLFTGAGRDFAGEVWLDTLGTGSNDPTASAMLVGAASVGSRRRHAQHKGSFGDVIVVGGASGMAGAALLAARAALAAGAGRVYVDALDQTQPLTVDLSHPELMFRREWWKSIAPDTLAGSTVVCGCGGGEAVRQALPRLLSAAARLVLDADALNAIASDASLAQLLVARQHQRRDTVLTPHPLEAARLLGTSTVNVQANRVGAASQLAKLLGAVVVLKGSGSVIADRDGTVSINGTGNAALASPGTGDVLAGWLGGTWSASGATALTSARHAAWLHGLAADLAHTTPLRASDLIEAMYRTNQAPAAP